MNNYFCICLAGLGIVICMDHQRIPQEALYWQVPGYERGPSRPRANYSGTVNEDLQRTGFTCEEAVTALDRHGWRQSVAQCVQLDARWIKVKVKVTCLTKRIRVVSLHAQVVSWFVRCACSAVCTALWRLFAAQRPCRTCTHRNISVNISKIKRSKHICVAPLCCERIRDVQWQILNQTKS